MCVDARVCVGVCVCVRARAHAHGMISPDKILRFRNHKYFFLSLLLLLKCFESIFMEEMGAV